MARKRKRSTQDTTTHRKRSKATLADSDGSPGDSPAQHPHGQIDEEREYKIRAIIDENRTHYRIDWEDDEVTGEKFEITWEPKKFANQLAIDDWEETKRQRKEAAKGAPQKKVASRGRGRPRKTIISSSPPPPEPSPHTNGKLPIAEQQIDSDLEIGESQPTVAGAEDLSAASSPLFVPLDSPKPRATREEEQPSVQISDPPSSYAAGAYQNLSSSQIPESAAPKRRQSRSVEPSSSQAAEDSVAQQSDPSSPQQSKPSSPALEVAEPPRKSSPEPSQWQPEEGDTSKTTADTTEVSAAPTSSSAPTGSAPVKSATRANNIVPDSQSQPDSSSFVPSGVETQSSSAPERRGIGRPPKEVTQSSRLSQTQSSWQGLSSQPAEASQPTQAPQVEEGSQVEGLQPSQPGASLHSTQSAPLAPESQESRPLTSSGVPQQVQSSPSQQTSTGDSEGEERARALDFASQLSGTQPSLEPSQDQLVSSASSDRPGDSASQEASDQPAASSGSEGARVQINPTGSQAHADTTQHSATEIPQSTNFSTFQVAEEQTSEDEIGDTTERLDSNHVELATDTQPPAGHISSIAVTPLPPRHTIAAQRNANGTLPAQSWPSPFPFQTQISQPFSSTASHVLSYSQSAASQGQHVAQSQPSLGPAFEPSTVPSAPSSAIQTSSPIPSAPKESLRTFAFGESAPARPTTPSSPARPSSQSSVMDGSPSSAMSGLEKVKAMRARHRAKLEADRAARSATPNSASPRPAPETSPPKSSIPPHVTADTPAPNLARLASPLLRAQDGARSPSAVPAQEALPDITTEDMNTSERYATLLPQASVAEESETQRNGSLTGRATPTKQPTQTEDPEKSFVHEIPISLLGHQRDQYPQMVYYHQELIQQFLQTRRPDDRLVEKTKAFVERIRSIALHPDLDNAETFTQYAVEPAQQATWDVSCSAKFRFLKALLDGLRGEKVVVVIAVRNSRLADILNTFLQGIDVSFGVVGGDVASSYTGSGQLTVTILVGDADVADTARPDLVVDLDDNFRHDDILIRNLRQSDGKRCPFAMLVVPRSIEHIENHLSPSLSDQARLRALVRGINQLQQEAGRLEEGQLNPTESATALVAYLKDSSEDKAWPLAGLSNLEDLDSQTESEIDPPEGTAASPAGGPKRQRTESSARPFDDLNKRVRLDPSAPELPTTVNPHDVELTHLSDSITHKPSQPENAIETPTEARLQTLLQTSLARADDLTSALSDLQYRHEDARTHLIRTTSERDAATATAETAIARMTEAAGRETALRAERTALRAQLEEAQAALRSHAVPERAELETVRQELARVSREKDALAKRLEQSRKDAEFFREQYQDASTSAQREVAANAELRNRVATLTNRASGEQARLRQMGLDTRTRAMEEEVKRLRQVVNDREAGMKFRDEEIARLKEASRGRMGTRGTSVPRSPRVASPMGAAGGRSRQGSPAVGEVVRGKGDKGLLHPLRQA